MPFMFPSVCKYNKKDYTPFRINEVNFCFFSGRYADVTLKVAVNPINERLPIVSVWQEFLGQFLK